MATVVPATDGGPNDAGLLDHDAEAHPIFSTAGAETVGAAATAAAPAAAVGGSSGDAAPGTPATSASSSRPAVLHHSASRKLHNAVPCPVHPQVLFCRRLLAPRPVVPALCLLSIGTGIVALVHAIVNWGTPPERKPGLSPALLNYTRLSLAGCYGLLGMYLPSLRQATLVDGGLDKLGLGSALISASERNWLRGRACFFGFGYVLLIGIGLLSAWWTSKWYSKAGNVLYWVLIIAPVTHWIHAVKVGAVLAQDQIIEVMDDMKAYRPTSRAWQERVAPGVVKLAKRTMPWLSDTFGSAFLWFGLSTWSGALYLTLRAVNYFVGDPKKLENHQHIIDFAAAVVISLLPLVLAKDVAACSSHCEELLVKLAERRKDEPNCQATHQAVRRLETIIQRENKGQGLGFVVATIVVNKLNLKTIAVTIVGLASAAIPVIESAVADAKSAQAEPAHAGVGGTCVITSQQVAHVWATFGLGSNMTECVFNSTIEEILRMHSP